MKFERLKIHGFKSFVDPAEFLIEPGLTGVVGPNGCGKSNLVEAMRWVMGESSYKAMRASGMDDVIFSGSGKRPARSSAEVTLTLSNEERRAPAGFNDSDRIEISRRIERESGSTYRINSREARARDVQLLFADASTGARSPAMVRQGQIGELIAAKPTSRRMILEEAAGISGLHSRRHEAEMRLRAAETNLTRLEDVLREIESRLDTLRRQAKQAQRYRGLSGDIRTNEAIVTYLRLREAEAAKSEAEAALTAAISAVADAVARQGEAVRLQAIAEHDLPPLRDAAVESAAAAQRLRQALAESEAEERRIRDRIADLTRRAVELIRDREREAALIADNDRRLAALDNEAETLTRDSAGEAERLEAANATLATISADMTAADQRHSELTRAEAELLALRAATDRERREAGERHSRLQRELTGVTHDLARLAGEIARQDDSATARADVDAHETALSTAEKSALAAESAVVQLTGEERQARARLQEAEREAQRLDTEARTLAKVLNVEHGHLFPPLVDRLKVAKGYEIALGVALGDDIEAPTDARAPAHWRQPGAPDDDPALPEGVTALADHVDGPPLITRCLRQIGVVEPEDGARLAARLKPGQCLVTKGGALWRWDGYVAAADAPTPAAQRLQSRNRLAELDAEREAANRRLADARAALTEAQTRSRAASDADKAARDALRAANRALGEARERLVRAERASAEILARKSALDQQHQRVTRDFDEARRALDDVTARAAALPDPAMLGARMQAARTEVADIRARLTAAQAALTGLQRDGEMRQLRLEVIVRDRAEWLDRAARAAAHGAELAARLDEVETKKAALLPLPDELIAGRRTLLTTITEAETRARSARETLDAAERNAASLADAARQALDALSTTREAKARSEARLEAAAERLTGLSDEIQDRFDAPVFALKSIAGIRDDEALPDLGQVEQRLERLKQEREKLGGVNLQAETEAGDIEERLESLIHEREDLIEAIRRLRQAIFSLNKEARERLLAAFDIVNGHFQQLFGSLFGGGTAELLLVDAEDPLEAGLDILAKPPGKKPQTLTLLSGGEQALTAMALIFAVFLTNPAPICVLDEVDAPLDDANVERYCDLLSEMTRNTDTRFVVITHNPITMARMNRLYGVTMAEKGVSQLVSVDLETAESFREAG